MAAGDTLLAWDCPAQSWPGRRPSRAQVGKPSTCFHSVCGHKAVQPYTYTSKFDNRFCACEQVGKAVNVLLAGDEHGHCPQQLADVEAAVTGLTDAR